MNLGDDYCPVSKAADVVADRWSVLIVRELLRGVTRFNELERSLPGISRSVLAQRLKHLERAGVLRRTVLDGERLTEYRLTDPGIELASVVGALNDWGVRWLLPDPWRTPAATPPDFDTDRFMMWVRRHVALDALPANRVVLAFRLEGRPRTDFWLVLRRGEASLCPEHPGFPEDARIEGRPSSLYQVLIGVTPLSDAIEDGLMRVEGPPAIRKRLPAWLGLRPAPQPAGTIAAAG